jgi:carboxypeptidase Q
MAGKACFAITAFVTLIGLTSCSKAPNPSDAPSSIPDNGSTPTDHIAPNVQGLIDAALDDPYAYDKLAELCDEVGHRLPASPGMKQAIAWSQLSMYQAGFDSVWTEPVTVAHWTRGQEWARCLAPVEFDLAMTGLGLSDGTGPEGVEAEVMTVTSFDDLDTRAAEAEGKIVLFNVPWEGYGSVARYRGDGASAAARHGAVAALVRSATNVSLGAPHTGMMKYADDAPRIPTAALSLEDTGRLARMCAKGLKPRVHLYMEAKNHGETTSYNVVGDIRGRELPEEIVLVAGHLDSWDVGTGAQDDGAGVVLALASARILLKQDLRPRRTVRVVHYTAEEYGAPGGKAYLEAHRSELDRHVLAIESDSGGYAPRGFSVDADSLVVVALAKAAAPLARVALDPAEWSVHKGGSGADIGAIVREGVVGVGHRVDHSHYFDVHHSRADTFEKVDPDHLARNVAAIAGLIYTVAESPARPGSLPAGNHSSGGH